MNNITRRSLLSRAAAGFTTIGVFRAAPLALLQAQVHYTYITVQTSRREVTTVARVPRSSLPSTQRECGVSFYTPVVGNMIASECFDELVARGREYY